MLDIRKIRYFIFIMLPLVGMAIAWHWWFRLGLDPLPIIFGTIMIGINLFVGLFSVSYLKTSAIIFWTLNYIILLIVVTILRGLYI